MPTQLRHDRLVIPQPAADKELNRLARHAMFAGNRLGRLALQTAEQTLDDDLGVLPLFYAIEPRQVPLQEMFQPLTAPQNLARRDRGIGQQRLGLGILQQRRPCRLRSVHV